MSGKVGVGGNDTCPIFMLYLKVQTLTFLYKINVKYPFQADPPFKIQYRN